MDDALGVRGGQARRDLPRDQQRARHRQLAVAAQHVGERLPFDERHRQVLDALDVADVVNADDVLVRDLPREHELALEAQLEIARRRRIRLRDGPDHLDGDADAQLVIERLVDRAHAAGAEQFEDRVTRADSDRRRGTVRR